MKRLTNDNPSDDLETELNLFYIMDYETWVQSPSAGRLLQRTPAETH